jgi:hypothetical protein
VRLSLSEASNILALSNHILKGNHSSGETVPLRRKYAARDELGAEDNQLARDQYHPGSSQVPSLPLPSPPSAFFLIVVLVYIRGHIYVK